ncbi:lysylphosphatidylglycerol synthase transmembrane domain-containing protein [Qipengyuania seohaensis]|uniref:lysylphosphatidylglycerol synthase transmembrane domain-containing protein n=1 Tax=Qipengyuania seohaensis TaxID=266951 RepID=UPI000C22B194|nr:lysylphosphatidylglycerol synthase transmembrane domain-containing protein [Qipengyuania seohaensis]
MPKRIGLKTLSNIRSGVALRVISGGLSLLSIIFIAIIITEKADDIKNVDVKNWEYILYGSLLYALSLFVSSLCFPHILRALQRGVRTAPMVIIGLVSQIGKYVPGNVAQYLGRGAMSKALGVPLRETGFASLIELAFALVSGIAIAFLTLSYDVRVTQLLDDYENVSALGVILSVLPIMLLAIWLSHAKISIANILQIFGLVFVSQIIVGLSFYVVLRSLGGEIPPMAAIGIFVAAWIIGFSAPGAPAGIGLRELAMVALLSLFADAAFAITVSLIHRTMTIVVDAIVAAAGVTYLSTRNQHSSSVGSPDRDKVIDDES